VSSAACERGFSQKNRPHTVVRNSLAITTFSDLLIISINSPYLRDWNVDKYILSWLKTERHCASDNPTGKSSSPKEPREGKKASFLYMCFICICVSFIFNVLCFMFYISVGP